MHTIRYGLLAPIIDDQLLCFVHFTNDDVCTVAVDGTTACPKCTKNKLGKLSCCYEGASWDGKCGKTGEPKKYTWDQGLESCKKGKLRLVECEQMCVHLI